MIWQQAKVVLILTQRLAFCSRAQAMAIWSMAVASMNLIHMLSGGKSSSTYGGSSMGTSPNAIPHPFPAV
jgi:hypothetical protein